MDGDMGTERRFEKETKNWKPGAVETAQGVCFPLKHRDQGSYS